MSTHVEFYRRTGHCGRCGQPDGYCTCKGRCGCADLHPPGEGDAVTRYADTAADPEPALFDMEAS